MYGVKMCMDIFTYFRFCVCACEPVCLGSCFYVFVYLSARVSMRACLRVRVCASPLAYSSNTSTELVNENLPRVIKK